MNYEQSTEYLKRFDPERIKQELAKRSLLEFTKYTEPNYHPNWHHEIICRYLEKWAFGKGKDAIRRLMVFLPPGSGKALEINTPIPTPNGFVRIKDLNIGDELFGSDGKICHVVERGNILYDRPACRIISNDETIIADIEHEWKVIFNHNGHSSICNTKYLLNRKTKRRAAIEYTKPLCLPDIDLPIDPYVLGVWLGDGFSKDAAVALNIEDAMFIRSEFNNIKVETSERKNTRNNNLMIFGIKGLKKKLNSNNLINNKHIPKIYLRSSINQRMSLLQGLMDTDGHVKKNGTCQFVNININLIEGIRELVASLGSKSTLSKGTSLSSGYNIIYTVQFALPNAARLPRKLRNCKESTHNHHYIRILPNDNVDTICIQVDSPNGMFLCGKSMIPTHNSELVSRRLPAWIFGHNPDVGIMATSYAASLASDMNIDVQRIMDSERYREIFPESALSGRNSRNSLVGSMAARNRDVFEIVGHKGYYKCAGVGGSITGKRFFYGIIDDPMRGRHDAESETIRNTVYNWYVNDFYTRRLNSDARILITLTRWHEADLAGRLLSLAASNPLAEQWTVLKFPMIAEDPLEPDDPRKVGESLWPWRYGTDKDLEATKISAGTYTWSSLYQQRPAPAGGSIFNRGWWGDPTAKPPNRNQFYPNDPTTLPIYMDAVILSADCTFKDTSGTDYVVIQVWGRKAGDFYLLDQKRERMDIIATMQNIRTLSAKWPTATAKLIEDKANGPAIITMMKREIPGLIAYNPGHDSKATRAMAVTPYIESGNVWLPSPQYAPWLHDLLEELASFPNGKHDDQVDALSQAISYLNTKGNFVLPKLPKQLIRVGGGWTG